MTNTRTPFIQFANPPGLASPPGYSHVVEVGGGRLLFIAGQVALDASGALVGKDDVEAQTDQVFKNLSAILVARDASFANLVKLTIFMRDVSKVSVLRTVRDRYLPRDKPPPASTLVEVSRLFRDEFLIEIEAVAWVE